MDPRLQALEFWNIGNLVQRLLWHIVHIVVSLWYSLAGLVQSVESNLISKGVLKGYDNLEIGKVKYLALVIESEDARRIFEVIELLQWLRSLGVKQVCLYDVNGVLKQSKEVIAKLLGNASLFGVDSVEDLKCDEKHMMLEFASISDGKEAVAKAANLLLKRFKSENAAGVQKDMVFTEQDMFDALKSIGYGAPDPDLLLVYGPARCHLGFPAWRLRYTEIVHMSPLKHKKRGALMKAIYKFTTVRQNYGK
uniref:ditrans,polycis-polyprenyl diphosphate synthase [(2E,6E)-farnesyldiphosphate specific] n=1 Tax=Kalanchoe fedtschenkoi TaxID=63787 RepID=A0A7N0TDB6_KALFE